MADQNNKNYFFSFILMSMIRLLKTKLLTILSFLLSFFNTTFEIFWTKIILFISPTGIYFPFGFPPQDISSHDSTLKAGPSVEEGPVCVCRAGKLQIGLKLDHRTMKG